MTAIRGSTRLSLAAIERLTMQLSDRDRRILLDLARVRLLSGRQLTRLHFSSLSIDSQERTRRRVLARLIRFGFVTTFERQIGGIRAGSAGLVYTLDLAGQRTLSLIAADAGVELGSARARRPWTPGTSFLAHTLTVSELYVQLKEAERIGTLAINEFLAEPASWFASGMGGLLKPDAYTVVRLGTAEDHWAIEVDKATESLPTLKRKLLGYVDFAATGQVGPYGVTPRVLVTVPHNQRFTALQGLIADLPEPGEQLISVALEDAAVSRIGEVLRVMM